MGASIPDRIGSTPLLRIEKVTFDFLAMQVLGKAGWLNLLDGMIWLASC